jgi:hypothetical protein
MNPISVAATILSKRFWYVGNILRVTVKVRVRVRV